MDTTWPGRLACESVRAQVDKKRPGHDTAPCLPRPLDSSQSRSRGQLRQDTILCFSRPILFHTPQLLSYRRYRAVGEGGQKCHIEPPLHIRCKQPNSPDRLPLRARCCRPQSIGSNNTDNCRFWPQVVILLTMSPCPTHRFPRTPHHFSRPGRPRPMPKRVSAAWALSWPDSITLCVFPWWRDASFAVDDCVNGNARHEHRIASRQTLCQTLSQTGGRPCAARV